MPERRYRYAWKNNDVRAQWYGRTVQVYARCRKMNSIGIEDVKTGERFCTSANAIRRLNLLAMDGK